MARKTSRRAGSSIVYVIVIMTAMLGMASFAVDYGRVELAKTQLQSATDAAARTGVVSLLTSSSHAKTDAKTIALANLVDGTGLVLTTADITTGKWNAGTGKFSSGGSNQNAIKITGHRIASRSTAIPLSFASLLGQPTCDINCTATAYIVSAINVNTTIPATDNPYLAGMPNGTYANVGNPHNNPDKAPAESPTKVTGITLTDGMVLTFNSISGTGTNDPGGATTGPDGDASTIVRNFAGDENGMSNMAAPINSLVGVFLDNSTPSSTSAPAMLDFSSPSGRDFTTLSPALKQVFFIGDGVTSGGATQKFIVPTGATRLYLASWDAYEWNNNSGNRVVQATKPQIVSLVE